MDHRVALLNTVFALDNTGCVTCGGGERYLIELCGLLRELDYDPQVWQPGTKTHEIEGIRVAGLPWGGMEYGTLPELNKQFRERTAGYDKFIYFVPVLAFPHVRPCSVVISHSVFWDSPLQPWTAYGGPALPFQGREEERRRRGPHSGGAAARDRRRARPCRRGRRISPAGSLRGSPKSA